MRPYAGNYQYEPDPNRYLPDAALLRLVTAFRITFPQVAIVLSTREPAPLRDAMAPLGVTHMSAGARTEPGGYTGAGSDDLHLTVKGRRVELTEKSGKEKATEQFQIHDTRSPAQVAEMLSHQNIDPVWKDFDQVLVRA
jgi:2-iminoacetate synthase